jgi:hypothetical protein
MDCDPIGPGSAAWQASEAAIIHAINGREAEAREARDLMTRELIEHGCSAGEIRQWENDMAERIANPAPDDFD